MSRSNMMVVHRTSPRAGLRRIVVGWLAGVVVLLGLVAVPAAADAVPARQIASPASESRPPDWGVGPLICRPEPPDYPGCTAEQVRPLLRARFASEYTGHAAGYRYHRMGQHRRGLILAHLTPALNLKLARLYHTAVVRYAAHHTRVVRDAQGERQVVVSYPHFRTWAGFKGQTTAFCNGTNLTIHFPTQYCWSVTKLGQAGGVIRRLLDSTARIAFSCNGFAIGGVASGSFAAWKMGTGLLAGGYYGAVGVEIGCQTTNLWNWASHLWSPAP